MARNGQKVSHKSSTSFSYIARYRPLINSHHTQIVLLGYLPKPHGPLETLFTESQLTI